MGVAALPVAALAVAAVGSAVSAYGAIAQGNAAKAAANYQAQVAQNNATIAGMNANAEIEKGNQQLQASQEQAAQHQGMIRAVMGASGIQLDSGSALRNQEGMAQVDQLNQATITSNAARAAWNYRNQGANYAAQSQLDSMQGANAATAGYMSGFSSLLSGAGTFARDYNTFRTSGAL
ncbi:hypothetical protein [Ralstonia pickettii]|uniref:virion core protein, T7 gp14 family n=1 Tax=Ralstonia pickettii TaxID=329 RepID=UPI0015FCD2C0|nr:hypothetical protein [Ralstonia pickettii]MBB0023626.1 hypothetical protein [Ralstonia pickettii]MBB0097015.1 hypothetical protein [Ralstonia pickettii]MBB0107015.1 hypothetical protein [Ralstonia pickettii]MBB0127788.1 hypothetical protein [Ralstonia pickettii]MBB0160715.1 hypothetical protein [Ralstonia pickettii]